MKVSYVVTRVEVGRVQRRYNVRRETLIRAGICEVRCIRKTELHLTLPAREAPLKSCSTPERFQRAVVPVKVEADRPTYIFRRRSSRICSRELASDADQEAGDA